MCIPLREVALTSALNRFPTDFQVARRRGSRGSQEALASEQIGSASFISETNDDCSYTYFTKMDILKAEIMRKRKLIEDKQLVDVSTQRRRRFWLTSVFDRSSESPTRRLWKILFEKMRCSGYTSVLFLQSTNVVPVTMKSVLVLQFVVTPESR